MDAIVNYSSEDELDEPSYKAAAAPKKRSNGRSRRGSSSDSGNTDASAKTPSPARRSEKKKIGNEKRIDSNATRNYENKRNNCVYDEDQEQPPNKQKLMPNTHDGKSGSHHHNREHSSRHDRNNYGDNRISKNYRNNNPKDHKDHKEYDRHRGKDSHYSSHSKDRHSHKYSSHSGGNSERSDNNRDANTKSKKDYRDGRSDNTKESRNARYGNNYKTNRDYDRRPNKDHYSSHQKERHYNNRDRNSRTEANSRRSTSKERGTHEAYNDNSRLQGNGTKEDRKEMPTTQNPPRKIEPLMSLPLSNNPPKISNEPSTSNSANDENPIKLPSYYNPSVINPNKYAEQVQKRKLIWGAKKTEDSASKWGKATFSEDSDGKVASKFMRLMGIKGGVVPNNDSGNGDNKAPAAPDVKSREAMFSNMEQQYEVARQVTHTMRGVGLGFSSQARQF